MRLQSYLTYVRLFILLINASHSAIYLWKDSHWNICSHEDSHLPRKQLRHQVPLRRLGSLIILLHHQDGLHPQIEDGRVHREKEKRHQTQMVHSIELEGLAVSGVL
jgi:hypothetical protein